LGRRWLLLFPDSCLNLAAGPPGAVLP